MLNDFLAPLMFEIDVDVRRLLALLGDEALEQQVAGRRIDRGDLQTVADRAVRRRAPPLAQDILTASEADDAVNGEEVARELHLSDQRKFLVQDRADAVRYAVRIALLRTLPCQFGEIFVGILALWHGFMGVFVTQFVEREGTRIGDDPRLSDGVGPIGEQPLHFCR